MRVQDLQDKLFAHLAEHWAGDAGHDLSHIQRVLRTAREIAKAEEAPFYDSTLTAAAILHDFVSVPKNSPDRANASRLSADAAVPLLEGMGFAKHLLPCVRHAIEAHSYSAGIPPETAEARALQDADRLDALGAIGIARCFAISGQLGRAIAHPDDPLALAREPDEYGFAVDHFLVKLLKLPDTMLTETGRRIGRERAVFMADFLRKLTAEYTGKLPEAGALPF